MKTSPAPKPTLAILGKRDIELGPFAIDEAPQEPGPWANWRLRTDEDGIAWLLFDKKDSSANTLSEDVLTELNAVLEKLERDRPRGLVIRSAKRSGFIAGADIAQFRGVTDPAPIEAALTRGHAVLDRLDRLPLSTVAVIHGYCLGGGLEVALACDFRIAIDDASFGFPEVLLGLHPGLGGTVRLTRLISPVQAMTMMLTGKTERARRARALHLVDAVTQERHVRAAVKSAVTGEMIAVEAELARPADEHGAGARPVGFAHARRDREEGAEAVLPGALRPDRSVERPWRRPGSDAEGGDFFLRKTPRH